jgi:hypothetical protein
MSTTEPEPSPNSTWGTEDSGPYDEVRAAADRARAGLMRAYTLENTPAAFMNSELEYGTPGGDAPMREDAGSLRLENELADLVRANPEAFAGTSYEPFGTMEPHMDGAEEREAVDAGALVQGYDEPSYEADVERLGREHADFLHDRDPEDRYQGDSAEYAADVEPEVGD